MLEICNLKKFANVNETRRTERMDFIKEKLLEKRRWRWANEFLKLGSQWMFERFGSYGCNTIATISLLAIFVWSAIGAVGILGVVAIQGNIVSLVIAYIVFFTVMIGILGTLMMSAANTEKPGS